MKDFNFGILVFLILGTYVFIATMRSGEYQDNSVECLKHEGIWNQPQWLSPGYCTGRNP